MRRTAIAGLLGAVLCLAGCIFFGPFGPVVLYEEAFNDDANWFQGDNDSRKYWLEDGKYHGLIKRTTTLENDTGNISYRTTVGPFDDFRLSIEVGQVLGPDNNSYGVIFRASSDAASYYGFRISGDGYAKFNKSINGTRSAIRTWEPVASINPGNATNLIEIIADGSTFTFLVNGETIYTVSDSSLSSGYIGVNATKYTELGGDLHVTYDNLRIEALE